jgi:hypothetical protein
MEIRNGRYPNIMDSFSGQNSCQDFLASFRSQNTGQPFFTVTTNKQIKRAGETRQKRHALDEEGKEKE